MIPLEEFNRIRFSMPVEESIFLNSCVCRTRLENPHLRPTDTVYFIGDLKIGLVKIGYSKGKGAEWRIRDIKAFMPFPIETIATVTAPRQVETALHRYLKDSRSNGEWFKVTPELLSIIELAQSGALGRLVHKWMMDTGAKAGSYPPIEGWMRRLRYKMLHIPTDDELKPLALNSRFAAANS